MAVAADGLAECRCWLRVWLGLQSAIELVDPAEEPHISFPTVRSANERIATGLLCTTTHTHTVVVVEPKSSACWKWMLKRGNGRVRRSSGMCYARRRYRVKSKRGRR